MKPMMPDVNAKTIRECLLWIKNQTPSDEQREVYRIFQVIKDRQEKEGDFYLVHISPENFRKFMEILNE